MKLAIYTGSDNRYFLQRNIQRLYDWIYKISIVQKNEFTKDSKKFRIKFICIADWMALEALFGLYECFFCNIKDGHRHERLDADGKRWIMTNPDEIPEGALLPIYRR